MRAQGQSKRMPLSFLWWLRQFGRNAVVEAEPPLRNEERQCGKGRGIAVVLCPFVILDPALIRPFPVGLLPGDQVALRRGDVAGGVGAELLVFLVFLSQKVHAHGAVIMPVV